MNLLVCISPETREEKHELAQMLDEQGCTYILYEPKKSLFLPGRYASKIYDSIRFLSFIRKHKASYIIGAPCLRNRMAYSILGIRYSIYLRSLHFLPSRATSLSDKLYFLFKKYGLSFSVLNPYMADTCLVSSRINREFLNARGIQDSHIFDIGAIWLNNKPFQKKSKIIGNNVIFLTEAYAEHGHNNAQLEQSKVIDRLISITKNANFLLTIRKHPRDNENYTIYEKYGVLIDSTHSDDFLNSVNEHAIILSAISTLAFELIYYGHKVIFLDFDSIDDYKAIYSQLDIDPIRVETLNQDSIYKLDNYANKDIDIFLKYNQNAIKNACQ